MDDVPAEEQKRAPHFTIALVAMTVVAFAWMQYVTWTQWASHRIFLADVGVFDMLISGPLHGHFMRWPLDWYAEGIYFGIHFSPIFLLLTPFYLLHDGAMTYLVLQNLALAAAAVPLGYFARRVLGSGPLALVVALLYLTNHFVGSVHLANHPEAFSFVFWFLMFLALERKCTWLLAVACLGVLSIKEDLAIFVGVFGVSLLMEKGTRRHGLALIAGAVAWFVFASVVMRLSGQQYFAEAGHTPVSRMASMGDTKGAILLFMVTHPHVVLVRLAKPALLWLYASTGFMALLDWKAFWLVIAGAGIFLIADDALISQLWYYYSYGAIPFLFYCSVRGMALLLGKAPLDRRILVRVLMGAGIAVALVNAVLPTRTDGLRRVPLPVSAHHALANEIADRIPEDVAIAVQYDLYNKVENRAVKLPMRLWALDHVEYVFLDVKGRPADLYGEEKRAEAEALYTRLQSDEFVAVIGSWENPEEMDGYIVLQRAGGAAP